MLAKRDFRICVMAGMKADIFAAGTGKLAFCLAKTPFCIRSAGVCSSVVCRQCDNQSQGSLWICPPSSERTASWNPCANYSASRLTSPIDELEDFMYSAYDSSYTQFDEYKHHGPQQRQRQLLPFGASTPLANLQRANVRMSPEVALHGHS